MSQLPQMDVLVAMWELISRYVPSAKLISHFRTVDTMLNIVNSYVAVIPKRTHDIGLPTPALQVLQRDLTIWSNLFAHTHALLYSHRFIGHSVRFGLFIFAPLAVTHATLWRAETRILARFLHPQPILTCGFLH